MLTILRLGKTPGGSEVRADIRRLVRRIRLPWPSTIITIRGDSHYGRWEAMEWCEQNRVQYVFGLAGNKALDALVKAETEAVDARWAGAPELAVLRDYTETLYAAETWTSRRRVVARIEATYQGLDTRYVVTNIAHCAPQWLYENLYCVRGQCTPPPTG